MSVKYMVLIWMLLISCVFADLELDYYWKDYSGGTMPANALMVDDRNKDNPTYVGQVYTKGYELLPATIHTTVPLATFNAYNKELNHNTDIKVLCSQMKNKFKWVRTSASTYRSLPGLIVGGSELHTPAYIGRIFRNGKAVLGKLGGALALPLNGHEEYIYDNFEVLVYEKPQVCSGHPVAE